MTSIGKTGELPTKKWMTISLFSLLLVALLGVIMRYKIGFEFPYLNQKNLQHAHSHFAFAGWVSQTLMLFMIAMLQQSITNKQMALYEKILWANLICAAGMLVSFSIQGYGFFSIGFSTASIFIAFLFTFHFSKDLQHATHVKQKQWFYASLLFNILSTAGTAALVYMMVTKHIPQHSYLASVYWYLHFQYNGWFFFTCMGLTVYYLTSTIQLPAPSSKIFWLLASSCFPAYGLSVLWLKLPVWLYIIVVMASVAQMIGWLLFLGYLKQHVRLKAGRFNEVTALLLVCIAVAVTIKLTFQLVSVIPAISQLAFGFRPIVIAYLHLVLLAITSLFLIVYAYMQGLVEIDRSTNVGILILSSGIVINEAMLGIQGIASLSYVAIPAANYILFGAAIIMFTGIGLLLLAQQKQLKKSAKPI
jgi:hypothetical protein